MPERRSAKWLDSGILKREGRSIGYLVSPTLPKLFCHISAGLYVTEFQEEAIGQFPLSREHYMNVVYRSIVKGAQEIGPALKQTGADLVFIC